MAYERYIKKDGRVYGPYTYHSRKVDGKVVSTASYIVSIGCKI